MKSKLEFSKIIFITVAVVAILVICFACFMIYKTEDLGPLEAIIVSVGAMVSTGIAFYYNKAKAENKIKLMKQNGIQPTEETFIESEDE